MNIPNVLNFDREYLSARQPKPGFASPNATPPKSAAQNIHERKGNFNNRTRKKKINTRV